MASTSGIFMIETNIFTYFSKSWVLDTRCGSHLGNNMQELKNSRTLWKNEVSLRVGNGARVVAVAIGTYSLSLQSGLVLKLSNCYYVLVISRNIILVSYLAMNDGFLFNIKKNSSFFYLNDIFYGIRIFSNGLYVLDLEKPILNINTKKTKINKPNQSYLWYCRFGHIIKTRITKLHKQG